MSQDQLTRLIGEVRTGKLSLESQDIVIKLLVGYVWLNQQLKAKKLSIKKMLRIFFGSKTEKQPSNKSPDDKDAPPPKPPGNVTSVSTPEQTPKPKGHGKNASANFQGPRVPVPHPTLKPGDLCPDCKDGRVYNFGQGSVVRFTGQEPIACTVYEPARLRCALCQEVFTADLPPAVGPERYQPSAKAMIALLTSGTGVPAYRLEGLQKSIGVALSDSTQFDLREDVANAIHPVLQAIEQLAANGSLLHNDDTPKKILDLMKENKSLPKDARCGMQTTGIVAMNDDRKLALFYTGRDHAGENLAKLMNIRQTGLPLPILMSDASTMNVTAEFKEILIRCLCIDHGRRKFVEILDEFSTDCGYVVTELAKIYKHDAEAKERELSAAARLLYHREHSLPIMNGLNTWMEERFENREVEPNSNLGQAIEYFLKHWNGLTQFLRIAGAPISNAEVERLLKKCVLHRKNSMFYKTQVGAWVGDILMSVIETARLNHVNPFRYLEALIKNAIHVRVSPESWLPWNYLQTLAN